MNEEKVTFQPNGEYIIGEPLNEMDVKKAKAAEAKTGADSVGRKVVASNSGATKPTMKKFNLNNIKKNAGFTTSVSKASDETVAPTKEEETVAATATPAVEPVAAVTAAEKTEEKVVSETTSNAATASTVADAAVAEESTKETAPSVSEEVVDHEVTPSEAEPAVDISAAEPVVEEPAPVVENTAVVEQSVDTVVEKPAPVVENTAVVEQSANTIVEESAPVVEEVPAAVPVVQNSTVVETVVEERTEITEAPKQEELKAPAPAKAEKPAAFSLRRLNVKTTEEDNAAVAKMDLMGLNEETESAPVSAAEPVEVPELTTDEKAPFIFHNLEEFLKLTNLSRVDVSKFMRAVVKSALRGNAIWSMGETPLRAYTCIAGKGGARNYIVPLGWDVHVTACYVGEDFSLTDGSEKLTCVDNCAFISGTPVALSSERNRQAKVL